MYEVNDHKKQLQEFAQRLIEGIENESIEGIIILKVLKNKETEMESLLGRLTPYEWVGILDFAMDVIKGEWP